MACFCLVLYLSVIFFVQCVFAAPKGITKIAPENHDFFGRITSYAHPKDVPDPVPMYQQFAALAQQSNCHNYHINISVGDATLLYSWGDNDRNQRLQLFHSKSLGIVASWAGMNPTSINSILGAADVFLVDVDRRYFPHAEKGAKLYKGFQDAYKRVAPTFIKELQYYRSYTMKIACLLPDSPTVQLSPTLRFSM